MVVHGGAFVLTMLIIFFIGGCGDPTQVIVYGNFYSLIVFTFHLTCSAAVRFMLIFSFMMMQMQVRGRLRTVRVTAYNQDGAHQ